MSAPVLIALAAVLLVALAVMLSGGTRVTIIHHDRSNDETKEQ